MDEFDEADRFIRMSADASNHVDSRVTRAFASAVVADRSGKTDRRQTLLVAVRTAEDAGTVDGFVCAYRAHPPLLDQLAKLENYAATQLLALASRLDPSLTRRLGRSGTRRAGSSGVLSPREREVLELLRKGLSNKEIGRSLWITESTAKVHVRHILEKLGVRTRTEAALYPIDDS
jgi:DNA-binding CsgD family transcriptional regulator